MQAAEALYTTVIQCKQSLIQSTQNFTDVAVRIVLTDWLIFNGTHCHSSEAAFNPQNNQNHQVSVSVILKRLIKCIHSAAKNALALT